MNFPMGGGQDERGLGGPWVEEAESDLIGVSESRVCTEHDEEVPSLAARGGWCREPEFRRRVHGIRVRGRRGC